MNVDRAKIYETIRVLEAHQRDWDQPSCEYSEADRERRIRDLDEAIGVLRWSLALLKEVQPDFWAASSRAN